MVAIPDDPNRLIGAVKSHSGNLLRLFVSSFLFGFFLVCFLAMQSLAGLTQPTNHPWEHLVDATSIMGQSLRVMSFWLKQGTQNGVPWHRV